MRVFVESTGKFAVKVPNEWLYENDLWKKGDEYPHSFGHYHNAPGGFQITCMEKTIGEIPKLIATHSLNTQNKGGDKLDFKEVEILTNHMDMYFWMAVVEDEFLLVTYAYESKKRQQKRVKKELERARATLNTILVVPVEDREMWLKRNRYDSFIHSMAASLDLRNRAAKSESAIEMVILLANYIDALLRLALVLKEQLESESTDYDLTLFFQSPVDRPIMEKTIYEKSLQKTLISQGQFERLNKLYNTRNKVVHRYIISDFKTVEVNRLVGQYLRIEEELDEVVSSLEHEQFAKGIGFNAGVVAPGEEMDRHVRASLIGAIREKHHDKRVNKGITVSKKSG